MSKPIIFFSHSSADKDVLYKLKELFVEKTGGTIEVFLSSDGQSIPFGRNWVKRVEKALEEAKIMVVFMTPNSLRSSWIYFEAGFAYSKGIRVVPVGLLGADIAALAPPLSLLQGFNVSNKDGLDNLIALANDTFSHSHKMTFSEVEYQGMMHRANRKFYLGEETAQIVDRIKIFEDDAGLFKCDIGHACSVINKIFKDAGYLYRTEGNKFESYGLDIVLFHDVNNVSSMSISVDFNVFDAAMLLVIKIIQELRAGGIKGIRMRIVFIDQSSILTERLKVTSRLSGSKIALGKYNTLTYKRMNIILDKQFRHEILVQCIGDDFELSEVVELLDILINSGVVFKRQEESVDRLRPLLNRPV